MKILIYLGHPAHFHLFRYTIDHLKISEKHTVIIIIKKKDVLENLLQNVDWEYINILPRGRKDNLWSIGTSLLKRDWDILHISRKYKPDIMIGTSAEISHIGKLLSIPSIVVNEDDSHAVPLFAKLAYPFATYILAPEVCEVGKWDSKKIAYNSYHELAYLNPRNFKPNRDVVDKIIPKTKRYFIVRFAKLGAHHDMGKSGISDEFGLKIINYLEKYGDVFITSERELDRQFQKYFLKVDPIDIHHIMFYADLLIGDSQTMAAESAVLGTPSIRFNDFVGKLGYLEELQYQYNLTFGIKTSEKNKLFAQIDDILNIDNYYSFWMHKRSMLLKEKIDLTAMLIWLLEEYPKSCEKIMADPDYQYNFQFN